MIVQCATFSKNLNPRNIDKNVSDIRNRIRLPYESSFWISVSGCKLTILPDIQPANRIVIISAGGLHSKLGCGKGRVGGLPFSATRPTHLRSQPDRLFVQPAGPPFCLLLEVFGRWFSWVRSNPVLQILNPNPIRIRHQLNSSNPTPVWVQEIYVNQTNSNVFLSTHKIQIQTGSGYRKENLTPDPVGSSQWPDTKNRKSSPCVSVDCIALNYWGKHKRKMSIRGIN